MNKKPIEQFDVGQCVESTDLRKSGKIVKIMPRKLCVQIEYWTQRGNKRNLVEIPFGSLFSGKNVDSVVYGLPPNAKLSRVALAKSAGALG